jgi:hypothetical protein
VQPDITSTMSTIAINRIFLIMLCLRLFGGFDVIMVHKHSCTRLSYSSRACRHSPTPHLKFYQRFATATIL